MKRSYPNAIEALRGLYGTGEDTTEQEDSSQSKRTKPEDEKMECSLHFEERLPNPLSVDNEADRVEQEMDHQGKIRSFPHVRGNWTSSISIPFDDQECLLKISSLVENCPTEKLVLNKEFHLSLTRVQVFRHHWIEPIKDYVRKITWNTRRFEVTLDEFDVFLNDDGTRTFLAMKVFPTKPLLSMLGKCDDLMNEFRLDPYYNDPEFHISVAWAPGDEKTWMQSNLLEALNKLWQIECDDDPTLRLCDVSKLQLKTGSLVSLFKFS